MTRWSVSNTGFNPITGDFFQCRSALNSLIIMGVAASDAHVVANHLIAYQLRALGYQVVNLGAFTPVADFAEAFRAYPEALAIAIGSLNGHVLEDLRDLRSAKGTGQVACPVIVGGNLFVGSRKSHQDCESLYHIGVDYILDDVRRLPGLLRELEDARQERYVSHRHVIFPEDIRLLAKM